MSIREKFELLANQWVQHCQAAMLSSDIQDYLNHPSYRELVSLGNPAVSYIIDRYQEDDFTPWGFLLDDITGLGLIENRNRFKPADIKKHWLNWWQVHAASYGKSGGNPTSANTEQIEFPERIS